MSDGISTEERNDEWGKGCAIDGGTCIDCGECYDEEPDYTIPCKECRGTGRSMEGWTCEVCEGLGEL